LLFYTIYSLLLSKETFFTINRWYLLSTLILGLLIPVFTVDFITFFDPKPTSGVVYLAEGFSELEVVIQDSVEQAQTVDYSWLTLVQLIYLLGLGVAFYKLLYGFRQIYALYRAGSIIKKGKYNLVLTNTPHLPFSFFNYLFWNKDTVLEEQDSGKILSHELAHINQWHSLDVLFLEFLSILLWFSPPIYWYKKSLRTVHEYLADAYVLRNTKKKQYGHLLIRQVQSGMQISLANNFIHSQLKQRIKMMTRNKSRRKQLMRYLPVLPLLLLMVLVFANKKVQQNLETTTAKATLAVAEVFENDTPPIFPGGEKAMLGLIYKNIRYPAKARKKGIYGTTKLQFVVEKDGTINSPQIVGEIGGGIEADILRVFQLMQDLPDRWAPATVNGEAVRTTFELPFNFRLEGYESNGETIIREKSITKKGLWITVTGLYADAPVKSEPYLKKFYETNKVPPQEKDEEPVYKVVEQMPRFPGCDGGYSAELKECGDQKMLDYIYANVKYPKAAREAGIQGTVVIRFIIKKDGSIDAAEIVRNVGAGTGEEALRVVNLMKEQDIKWIAGKQDGEAVNVYFNLPIKFKLTDDKKNQVKDKEHSMAGITTNLAIKNDPTKFNLSGDELTVNAYPNPAKDHVNVTLRGNVQDMLLTIFDMNGKEYSRDYLSKFNGTLNKNIELNGAAGGMLIINVRHQGKDYQKKVLVQ
ncbi:MAG: TonB family protein, partial [Bacteroidota bacterium]